MAFVNSMKLKLAAVLFALMCAMAARSQSPAWQDFESLLGKPIMSPEVQLFIKTNHLNQSETATNGTGICESESLTNVPFTLFYQSNKVQRVDVAIGIGGFAKYTGKLGHDLRPTDTPETIIQRFGKPSRQKVQPSFVWLRYDKLRLDLDFDLKSRRLETVGLLSK